METSSIQSEARDHGSRAREADELRTKGIYSEAIERFNDVLSEDRTNAWAYAHRGAAKGCILELEGAIEDFDRAIELQRRQGRGYAWAHAHKGEAYRLYSRYHLWRTGTELEARLGRHPTEAELAQQLEMSVEELEKMMVEASAVNLISLNKKWYETDSYKDVREIDILEDKKAEDPTGRLQNRDLMRLVTRGLNRNERLIVILYYYEEMTMKEIGATLNLSESRVSQMHSSIVQRLQAHLNKRKGEFGTN